MNYLPSTGGNSQKGFPLIVGKTLSTECLINQLLIRGLSYQILLIVGLWSRLDKVWGHVSVQSTIYMLVGVCDNDKFVSVTQWWVCVCLGECVCVCHSTYSLSSWVQGACLTHITSIKVMSRTLLHKSLFTSPTLLKTPFASVSLVNHWLKFLCRFKLVIGSHLSSFVKRKVTPTDQELNTILRHPSVLDFTNEILCLCSTGPWILPLSPIRAYTILQRSEDSVFSSWSLTIRSSLCVYYKR